MDSQFFLGWSKIEAAPAPGSYRDGKAGYSSLSTQE